MMVRTCPLRQRSAKVPGQTATWSWKSDIVEICLGALCSAVIWRYTSRNDHKSVRKGFLLVDPDEGNGKGVLVSPSDGLMLWSCLVYGCCVSSFIHRRQDKDPFQLFVYLIFATCAGISGYAVGASANLMLLGYLPWALCIAMAASLLGHSLYRRWKYVAPSSGDEEKLQSIR
ncbi:hypothetical protein B0T20DRAFT_239730 [Sordaria brevicollis]|uniref:Uncharacterized protein n=1 Tax=Sordaria brevicollis TaxID=83679 RepID=A0AAE0PDQ2_SORBR|nr:hypothetical protein B0T20DRAFT_239730 [Sordaria brevicollis]